MPKGLRILYGDKNGNLYSPFGILGALGYIPKRDSTWLIEHVLDAYNEKALKNGRTLIVPARQGERQVFSTNVNSAGKHDDKKHVLRFNDPDNMEDFDVLTNDAPHVGASVMLRSDPKHSVYGLGDIMLNMFGKDIRRARRDKSVMPFLKGVIEKGGMPFDEFIYDVGDGDFVPAYELYSLPTVLGPKFDGVGPKRIGSADRIRQGGYRELADTLYNINRLIYENENKGAFKGKPGVLQLWKVEFDDGDVVSRDDITDNRATAFRDTPGDVAVKAMTPIQQLDRKKVDDFIYGTGSSKRFLDRYGDIQRQVDIHNSEDPGMIDLAEQMYRDSFDSMFMENDGIPSDRLLKNIHADLDGWRSARRRNNCILKGIADFGRRL